MHSRVIQRVVARIAAQGELPDSPGQRRTESDILLCAGACVVAEVLREGAGNSAAAAFEQAVITEGGKSLLISEADRLGIARWVKTLITENDRTEPASRPARLIGRISAPPPF